MLAKRGPFICGLWGQLALEVGHDEKRSERPLDGFQLEQADCDERENSRHDFASNIDASKSAPHVGFVRPAVDGLREGEGPEEDKCSLGDVAVVFY